MKNTNLWTTGLLVLGIILGLIAIPLMYYNVPGIFGQLFAIIASAFLGAGATSWMTRRLLDQQQKAEEEKEKNVQIHQNKIDVYSEFIREIWNKDPESEPKVEATFIAIRHLIFNKLVFYLDKSELTDLKDLFNTEKLPKDRIQLYSQITDIVRRGIDEKHRTSENVVDNYSVLLKELWNAISNIIGDYQEELPESENDKERMEQPITEEDIIKTGNTDSQYQQAWHFAMWGDEQLDAIGDGKINELSLVEYDEYWRTNLAKQVCKDDYVFLFRRGGSGYLGAFRPIGLRIFEREKDNILETIHYYDERNGKDETKRISEKDADVEKYDIYGGLVDGATLCTNLIVEIIAYKPNGVGNPGGVYRRTISRYDKGYANTLLEWLNKAE